MISYFHLITNLCLFTMILSVIKETSISKYINFIKNFTLLLSIYNIPVPKKNYAKKY